jgi:hypothetical protein
MKLALLITLLAQIGHTSDAVVTLRELITNSSRSGTYLLNQGYRGKFTKIYEEVPTPGQKNKATEFTHALFNDRGVGNRSPAAPTLAIGVSWKQADGRPVLGSRAHATYQKTIPDFGELKTTRNIKDFQNIFGAFRGITDGWGSREEMHSSLGWLAFTIQKDGSIRVVHVFLHTVDNGNGWEIWKRDIKEGIFRPTGRPPKPELEEAEPNGAANLSQPVRSATNSASQSAGFGR